MDQTLNSLATGADKFKYFKENWDIRFRKRKLFVVLVDECKEMNAVYFPKEKSEVSSTFKVYKAPVEHHENADIQCFRLDKSGEQRRKHSKTFTQEKGISMDHLQNMLVRQISSGKESFMHLGKWRAHYFPKVC